MTGVLALWLPILLSAVAVFAASSLIHMVLPWHKSDYQKVANEDQLRVAMRALAIPPGDYFVPRPDDRQSLKTPEFAAKMNEGPVMMFTILPNGGFSMARNLSQWFVYCLVVGLFAAYLAVSALPASAPGSQVAQVTGVTSFIGYTLALWQMSIWYRRAWSLTFKVSFDGVIYAALTAAIFAWLWPH